MSALGHGNGFPYDLFINYLNGKEEISPNWAWTLRLNLHTNINVCLKRLIASFNHQIVFWLLTKCEAYSELLLEGSALDKHHNPLLKLQLHDCDLLRWRRVRSFSVTVNNAHWCSNLRLRGVAVMCKVKKTLLTCYKRELRLSGRGTRPLQTSNSKGTTTVAEATQMDVRSLRHLREMKRRRRTDVNKRVMWRSSAHC